MRPSAPAAARPAASRSRESASAAGYAGCPDAAAPPPPRHSFRPRSVSSRLPVNLLELGGRPLDGLVRATALGALCGHVHRDVISIGPPGLRRGGARQTHRTRGVGGGGGGPPPLAA